MPVKTRIIRIGNSQGVRIPKPLLDLQGREIAVPAARRFAAGVHEVPWAAEGFPSGVYLCRLEAGSAAQTRVLLLIRP